MSAKYKQLSQEYTMPKDSRLYFKDDFRKIDFVLYRGPAEGMSDAYVKYREQFLSELEVINGVNIESDIDRGDGADDDGDENGVFYRLHVPDNILLRHAEDLNFRMPIQLDANIGPGSLLNQGKGSIKHSSESVLKRFHLPNVFQQEVPNQPPNLYKANFRADRQDRFLGGEDPSTMFSDAQRSRICYEILETTRFGRRNKGEIGIKRLIAMEIFQEAYPLHDRLTGPVHSDSSDSVLEGPGLNKRQVLHEYWGRWGKWYKYQPLDHVREYFGEKIALYFAWLGHYTMWLFLPSFVGLLVFLYGVVTINSGSNQDAHDICNAKPWEYRMCPQCDESVGCKYWDLKGSCTLAKISYLFDNAATVFFAAFVSFWAVFFQEFWKRKESMLAYHWDCNGFEEEAERPRPSFTASAPDKRKNPITDVEEPFFPPSKRRPRVFSGILIVITMVSLVIIFTVGVIVYKLLIFIPLAKQKETQHYAFQIASATGAVCNLICIMILSTVYQKVAVSLTDWEMHRTETEYEDSLTFKVFVFQFVNFYSSIFYIAFFKGKLIGYPGNYNKLLGLRQEECAPGGCLIELAQQLFIIMVGKQIIGNVQEVFIPMVKSFLLKRKLAKKEKSESKEAWEEDYTLVENEGLFSEYLEMIIQFGFITIFVAAFPIAPFFALANNVFEIRIDSIKLVTETKRPVAERAQDIGIWFNILDSVVQIAVVSNAFLIAFTSSWLPKMLYRISISEDHSLHGYLNYSLAWAPANATIKPCRYRDFRDQEGNITRFYWHLLALKLGFVIIFEHFVFATNRLIDLLVPDVPEDLSIEIQKEALFGKRALQDHTHQNKREATRTKK